MPRLMTIGSNALLAVLVFIAIGLFATGADAQQCEEIRFAPGASYGDVSGQVIDGSPMCFTFGAGAGQSARLDLTGSDNTCFNIEGVVDCQDSYAFATARQTYRVMVHQLFPRTVPETFDLRLTIR